jgi:hypothetical protein
MRFDVRALMCVDGRRDASVDLIRAERVQRVELAHSIVEPVDAIGRPRGELSSQSAQTSKRGPWGKSLHEA